MLLKRIKGDYLSNTRIFLPTGIILSFISTLIRYFGSNIEFLAFLEGVFSGISFVFLIVGLYFFGRLKRLSISDSQNDKTTTNK